MLDYHNAEKFRTILREAFERKILLDHYSLASYYVKATAFICAIQGYYENEFPEQRIHLLDEVNTLIQSKPDEFDEADISSFLEEVKADLEYGMQTGRVLLEKGMPWRSEALSKHSMSIPGMLYPDTMRYYRWITSKRRLQGAIVELGCWLGQSTHCLVDGLLQSEQPKKLHVFDTFLWEEWMNLHIPEQAGKIEVKAGESFLGQFMQYCKNIIQHIDVHVVDLNEANKHVWNNGPISLLVYDISNEVSLLKETWSKFSCSFLREQTVIVFNQFGNARSEGLRRFCREKQSELRALHKINGSAKSFLFTGKS